MAVPAEKALTTVYFSRHTIRSASGNCVVDQTGWIWMFTGGRWLTVKWLLCALLACVIYGAAIHLQMLNQYCHEQKAKTRGS